MQTWSCFLTGGWLLVHAFLAVAQTPAGDAPRRPVAIALQADRLLIANRDRQSVSVVDGLRRRVVAEWPLDGKPVDLCLLPQQRQLVTADAKGPQLLVVSTSDGHLVERLPLPPTPVAIRLSPDGSMLAVSALWARQVLLFSVTPDDSGEDRLTGKPQIVALPFAPGQLLWLPGRNQLLAADAFQGRLAVIQPRSAQVIATRTIDGHNIGGLAYDPDLDSVLITHQQLTPHLPTTRDRVFWGNVISNLLRTVRVDHLLEGSSDGYPPIAHWMMEPLGGSGEAAGDPGRVVVDPQGRRIVCLTGVGQLAVSQKAWAPFARVDVGDQPVAMVVDAQRQRAFVVNAFEDSLSEVALDAPRVMGTMALGERPPRPGPVQVGEQLFHNARLSLDGWMSCHSCHPHGHTNGLLNDNFGDDVEGTPKQVLSLLGVGQTGPWSWLGWQDSLGQQVAKSIRTTMRSPQVIDPHSTAVADLVAFLQTLEPPPSVARARGELDPRKVEQGAALFRDLQCAQCHPPPTFTSPIRYDVGLSDEAGHVRFNPPSLRGVDQRNGWLHDGRAKTLRQVFRRFGHPNGATTALSSRQVDQLIAYLQSL